ncbi:SDR family NAD(P)-dependent oxidoreductase [Mucisphaera sp.]|uniref:SDR family NAD(P)-dependent oxidoreductase n=1 Tax=Mucisphaera sp. TaxID=2913024 RepID=UPI003D123CB7
MTDSNWPIDPNPVCIITGAGSGVGRDTACLMAEAGFRTTLISRTEEKLQATRALIEEEVDSPPESLILPLDLSSPEACQQAVDKTVDHFGRIDAIANCAGDAPLQPIEKITPDIVNHCLAINLNSVIFLTQAAWPHFRKQKAGAISSVSSMASIDPFKGFNVYAAAKAGVNLFTKAAADEGQRMNITAFAIAPGAIETPMLRANFSEKAIPADNALDPMVVAGIVRDGILRKGRFANGETFPLPSPH